ncbi:cytochrome b [Bacillus cereus]|uniref:cytochrome b n=1 Tax=Bacillus thuringiensis TaxID=1428 RepID=UPI000676C53E|nr:cytochrome b [Bacillus thuringiensis]MEB8874781.1 cytochrome b [Bacillus cereus]AKR38847.1 Cytochrome b [Bacillus thuringiensis serovar indiana]MEB9620136.1 cytochrome b [Bacillus cereus]MEB9640289.1 cytochrome b [Bacillus cereus]MEB9714703.1 cytochrome b [Bacillus cereus]
MNLNTNKIDKYLFWFIVCSYICIHVLVYSIWSNEGLYSSNEGTKIMQEYIKTFAQTNLSVIFGLAAILIGAAALNYKNVTQVVDTKRNFFTAITTMMLFILVNALMIPLSFTKLLTENKMSQMFAIVFVCALFVKLLHNIITLIDKILGISKKKK